MDAQIRFAASQAKQAAAPEENLPHQPETIGLSLTDLTSFPSPPPPPPASTQFKSPGPEAKTRFRKLRPGESKTERLFFTRPCLRLTHAAEPARRRPNLGLIDIDKGRGGVGGKESLLFL